MKSELYNIKGEKIGEIDLPEYIFNEEWNPDLVHQVVTGYLANRRRGTAHTKTRSEVSGGGRKPWPQKGTGRARHGSIRSPIWRGGGVVFGPRKEKIYKVVLPKKMRRKALFSSLSQKLRDKEIFFVEDFDLPSSKTRDFLKIWEPFSQKLEVLRQGTVRIVLPDYRKNIILAVRNLEGIDTYLAKDLTAYEVLKPRYLVMLASSVETLQNTFKPVKKEDVKASL